LDAAATLSDGFSAPGKNPAASASPKAI
jgi:hypothetical protein